MATEGILPGKGQESFDSLVEAFLPYVCAIENVRLVKTDNDQPLQARRPADPRVVSEALTKAWLILLVEHEAYGRFWDLARLDGELQALSSREGASSNEDEVAIPAQTELLKIFEEPVALGIKLLDILHIFRHLRRSLQDAEKRKAFGQLTQRALDNNITFDEPVPGFPTPSRLFGRVFC